MKSHSCAHEDAVAAAANSGVWTPELRAHRDGCMTCAELTLVVAAMAADAEELMNLTKPLPDPGIIWLRARLAEREDKFRRATRGIVGATGDDRGGGRNRNGLCPGTVDVDQGTRDRPRPGICGCGSTARSRISDPGDGDEPPGAGRSRPVGADVGPRELSRVVSSQPNSSHQPTPNTAMSASTWLIHPGQIER